MSGLRLPIAVKDGAEEIVYERIFLLEMWHGLLSGLVTRYALKMAGLEQGEEQMDALVERAEARSAANHREIMALATERRL